MQWHERIGQRIRLRDLHILLAAAEAGTMAKAAAALGISQPAVSKAIGETEQTLGVRLLDRTTKGLVPTEYGQALLQRAVTIFDELRQVADELRFLADPMTGQLRLGCSESMTAGLLPAIIAQMSSRYPRVTLHAAQTSFAPLQFRELRERTIELVLGRIHWLKDRTLSPVARLFIECAQELARSDRGPQPGALPR